MDNNHRSATLAKAREMWLFSRDVDMKEVERLYRSVIASAVPEAGGTGHVQNNKAENNNGDDLTKEASEKLALILCQSTARSHEAVNILSGMGYTCRLSSMVLNYPLPTALSSLTTSTTTPSSMTLVPATAPTEKPPCRIFDNFLTDDELLILQSVFMHPKASYWGDHDYSVEPPSPYFSYLIPLAEAMSPTSNFGFIGRLVQKVYRQLQSEFPLLDKATCVELWAHNRPHASGHQMHFDSDNEGMGGTIRNPIISTILYITGSHNATTVGGPSLVTNQKLIHRQLATRGWISHAKAKRLVAFDGKVLHGVVPGKECSAVDGDDSTSSGGGNRQRRRVTLMLAFWKKIKVRTEGGAARAFPATATAKTKTDDDDDGWAKALRRDFCPSSEEHMEVEPIPVDPVEIKPIYETLQGEAWTKEMGFPDYDQVYQGF